MRSVIVYKLIQRAPVADIQAPVLLGHRVGSKPIWDRKQRRGGWEQRWHRQEVLWQRRPQVQPLPRSLRLHCVENPCSTSPRRLFPQSSYPGSLCPQGALANMTFLILSYLSKNEQHWEIHWEPLSAEGINITSCSQVDRSFFPTNLPFL